MAHYDLDSLIEIDLFLACEIFVMKIDYERRMYHNSQMMADLEEAFNLKATLGLDVIVKCGDASFECSKFMLTARSPVFDSMFQSNMMKSQTNVVKIENLMPEVVAEMLQYIHTGASPHLKEMSQELLVAADRSQLEQLKTSCQ